MKKHMIVWQKWIDPFGSDDEENIDQMLDAEFNDEENPETNTETSDWEDDKDEVIKKFTKSHKVRVLATPMGIIPFNENTASGKIFNFWMGHTNFNISRKIVQIIEETDGVETLDIFTRYRFRIAIGKVFKDADVMKNINDNVYEYLG
jgi:hypothetical protein